MSTINGTSQADTLNGTSGDDVIYGFEGNDKIITNNGIDYVDAGDGDDQVNGYPIDAKTGEYSYYEASGSKKIIGGSGNDFLVGGSSNDIIYGGTGNDIIHGRDGNDTLFGESGDDSIYGENGDDSIDGGSGDDMLYGGEGNDTLIGGDGNDTLWGGNGDDLINGGNGNDRLITGNGNDEVHGGSGDDEINGYLTGSHQFFYWNSNGNLKLYGEDGDDVIIADKGNDYLSGGNGNDELYGQSGDDTLDGGAGDDYLSGGDGNDLILGGDGNDRIITGNGNDEVHGGSGDDQINGYLTGIHQYTYWNSTGNLRLYGEDGNDFVLGDLGDDYLSGGDGNDELYGRKGDDTLDGGAGDDFLSGDEGNDRLDGGLGNDTIYGGEGDDILIGGDGVNYLDGGNGNDTYYISNKTSFIEDAGGVDTAYVSANFVKVPSSIEKVIYINGALPLPYWIDSLISDGGAGLYDKTLLGDRKTFNYGFPTAIPSYDKNLGHSNGYTGFNQNQIADTKIALNYISSVFDIGFLPTSNFDSTNTIVFALNDQVKSSGYAQEPNNKSTGSDVFLSNEQSNKTLNPGTYGSLTLMHELGHALGLKHPFSAADSVGGIAEPPYLSKTEDVTKWTDMSYTDAPDDYLLKYSPLDIAALQYIYGPSTTSRIGNDTYTCSEVDSNFIWDGGGIDTLSVASASQSATVYLTPGYWGYIGKSKASLITMPGQITVNFGSQIENLTGSAFDDKLYGNELNNVISGGYGNDSIEGWDGSDTIIGGAGDDLINGGNGIDCAQYLSASSNYIIQNSSSLCKVIDKRVGNIADGADTLTNTERIKFSDKSIAIDFDGNAGIVAKVLGAVIGKDSLTNSKYVGVGLNLLDKGMSYPELGKLALDAVGVSSPDGVVDDLWKNIVGNTPSKADKAPFLKMIQDGLKLGELVVLAADSDLNKTNINLTGLSKVGIEYLPQS